MVMHYEREEIFLNNSKYTDNNLGFTIFTSPCYIFTGYVHKGDGYYPNEKNKSNSLNYASYSIQRLRFELNELD